jgi:hypothetical protein
MGHLVDDTVDCSSGLFRDERIMRICLDLLGPDPSCRVLARALEGNSPPSI